MLAALAGLRGPTMSRRTLLAGSGAVALGWALAGCSGDDEPEPGPSDSGTSGPPPDPDAALRVSVLGTADSLIASYLATTVAHPELTAVLEPLLADHRAHVAVLNPAAASTPSTSPAPTTTTSGGPSGSATTSTPSGEPVPSDPGEALGALRDGERSAADVARSGAVAAADPALARLFASISASRTLHAQILDEQ